MLVLHPHDMVEATHLRNRSSIEERERCPGALKLLRANSELATKTRYASRLELLLRQRLERIDQLTAQVDQLRTQNRRLDAEAEHLAQMVAGREVESYPSEGEDRRRDVGVEACG